MNIIGTKIRKIREEKGITQEYMATELEITQSNYGRLEKDDKRLTVPKLMKIAEVLCVSISNMFDEQHGKVIHQLNNQSPAAYNVEHLYQDNEGVYERLNELYQKQIDSLKEEVEFLRTLSKKNAH